MYATENNKTRQSQLINSRKSTYTCMNPKISDANDGVLVPIQVSKSKFTVLRNSKASRQPVTTVTLLGKVTTVTKRELLKPDVSKKSNIPITSGNRTITATRISQSLQANSNGRVGKRKNQVPLEKNFKTEPVAGKVGEIAEMAIQTIESEILNHSLIVGDLKIVTPSKSITNEIDKLRKEMEKKKLLMATRKFEEHSQHDEQHLDALMEFLDKSYITRRPHKISENNFEDDRKLIASMDELMQREKPKTESITDIRSRIKNKEQELLSLFEHFKKKTENLAKTTS